ncbi:MAG: rubrerythrin family protein [Methanobacteriota archaeon]|nr:MAG: rubrerythrin family protein [Euryarchaeota archaeon]
MRAMTEMNLKSAFAGESQARNRYDIYAGKAEVDGFPNVARLFRAVAYAEHLHAKSHFKVLKQAEDELTVSGGGFGFKDTSENLVVAIEGETFEVEEMYPAYLKVAEEQEEKSAARSFSWALEAEKMHQKLYTKAKEAVDGGNDVDLGPIQICEICGWTVEGDAPDECPLCKARKDRFRTFE